MGIEIEAVPMYNLKFGSAPGKPYHHKGIGNGYILNFGDTRVYFSGDTECMPEMKALKNITVAFVAMNPPRTQSAVGSGRVREGIPAQDRVSVSLSRAEHAGVRGWVEGQRDRGALAEARRRAIDTLRYG